MQTLKVNLLPRDYRPPRSTGLAGYALAAAVVVAVGGIGYAYWSIHQDGRRLLAEAEQKETADRRTQAALSRAEALAGREEAARAEQQLLEQLQGRRWWQPLMEFARLTPPGMNWVRATGGENRIELEGQANRVLDLGRLLTGLIASPEVERVEFHEAVEEESGRYRVQITIYLQGPAGEVSGGEHST